MPSGKKIKELRLKAGLTQKELADICGMADSAIRRYENGNANPKIETLALIAHALCVPLSELWPDNLSPLGTVSLKEDLFNLKYHFSLIEDNKTLSENEKKEVLDELYKICCKILNDLNPKYCDSQLKQQLNKLFDMLNDDGQHKAIEQVEMLTKINDFRIDTDKKAKK